MSTQVTLSKHECVHGHLENACALKYMFIDQTTYKIWLLLEYHGSTRVPHSLLPFPVHHGTRYKSRTVALRKYPLGWMELATTAGLAGAPVCFDKYHGAYTCTYSSTRVGAIGYTTPALQPRARPCATQRGSSIFLCLFVLWTASSQHLRRHRSVAHHAGRQNRQLRLSCWRRAAAGHLSHLGRQRSGRTAATSDITIGVHVQTAHHLLSARRLSEASDTGR